MDSQVSRHPHYDSRAKSKNRTIEENSFRLRHYAGDVDYNVEGFMDKNQDLLFKDIPRVFFGSENSLLKSLFPEGDAKKGSQQRPPTAGTQFKKSVAELTVNLTSKNPHYIRCIKPNEEKRPRSFDSTLVRHQVRYLGLMENIRVRRAGFAFRQEYSKFLQRYKMLCPKTWPLWNGSAREGTKVLLDHLNITGDDCAYGNSKIFIRLPSTLFKLEDERRVAQHRIAAIIQSRFKGWRQLKIFQKMKASQIKISAKFRAYRGKKEYMRMKWAAIRIAAFVKGWKARKQYAKMFTKVAGPKVIRFIKRAFRYRYLTRLAKQLPSVSPLANEWPESPRSLRETNRLLKAMYHRWRCAKHRKTFTPARKLIFEEKLWASETFRNKKANYHATVPVKYRNDVANLKTGELTARKWEKVVSQTGESNLIYSSPIQKMDRANGKVKPMYIAFTNKSVLLLGAKAVELKYQLAYSDIKSVSVSTLKDNMVIFHIAESQEDKNKKKGDFVLMLDNAIEAIVRLHYAAKDAGATVRVNIADS